MSRIRTGLGLAAASTLMISGLLGGAVGPVSAQDASPAAGPSIPASCSIVADQLANPRHLRVGDDGIVYVALAGSGGEIPIFASPVAGTPPPDAPVSIWGDTGGVLAIDPDGVTSTAASGLPSFTFGTEVNGPSGVAVVGTTLYVISDGAGQDVVRVAPLPGRGDVVAVDLVTGETRVVADLEAFALDPVDPQHPIDSNPFAIIAGDDGMLYAVDAANNDVLKIDPETGEVSLLALLPGFPSDQANPERGGRMELDPVPTGLAWAPDGGLYISLLSGAPFIPGGTTLVHVAMDGTISTVASGLTMLGDVAVAPDGSIYVVTISENFIDSAGPTPGAIVKVNTDGTSSTVLSGLPMPGGIAFDADGNAYISAVISLPVDAPAGGMVLKCDTSSW